MRPYLLVGFVLALTTLSGPASAQEPPAEREVTVVEPSAAQLEMNAKGAEAFLAKDYTRAIDLFRSSLALGELNITYLNLGRSYQLRGDCVLAKDAYDKARYSRVKVTQPPASAVQEKIKDYQKELSQTCTTGELVVACAPLNLNLAVDGVREAGTCPSVREPLQLQQGQFTIMASHPGYVPKELVVAVLAAERLELDITLKPLPPKPVESPVIVKPEPEPPKPPKEETIAVQKVDIEVTTKQEPRSLVAPIVLTSLGVLSVTGGLLWDNDAVPGVDIGHVNNGELDATDFGPVVMYVVGGILALSGVTSF